MQSLFALLAAILLVTSASASTFFSMPLTKLALPASYLAGLPDADRARAAFLKAFAAGSPTTVPASNLAYVQYTTSVGVGTPPTYYNLVVDTGSSNTFVGYVLIDYLLRFHLMLFQELEQSMSRPQPVYSLVRTSMSPTAWVTSLAWSVGLWLL